jgi:hypothetical protein
MLHVVDARSAGEYRLYLRFSDGVEGLADLSRFLWGPVFEALREADVFTRFRISGETGAVEWENGADLAPEALWDIVVTKTKAGPSAYDICP